MAIKSNQHVIKTKNYCEQLHALLQSQVEKELSVRDRHWTRTAPSNIFEALLSANTQRAEDRASISRSWFLSLFIAADKKSVRFKFEILKLKICIRN